SPRDGLECFLGMYSVVERRVRVADVAGDLKYGVVADLRHPELRASELSRHRAFGCLESLWSFTARETSFECPRTDGCTLSTLGGEHRALFGRGFACGLDSSRELRPRGRRCARSGRWDTACRWAFGHQFL